MIKINPKNERLFLSQGYTLVELIFYVALFTVLTILVINSLITMTKAFKETTIQTELGQSSAIIERISREIRQASSINTISANDLKINTTNDVGNGKTIEFLLSGSNVQLIDNGVLTGNLNTPNIAVTVLSFSQITDAQAQAIKISLTVKSNDDVLGRTADFYDTVVLRGSY